MKSLIIEETEVTPAIDFNATTGVLKISGKSYSNDINRFYADLDSWVDKYLVKPKKTTTIILQLDYYNSGFFKLLFILIGKCKRVLGEDKNLIIKWMHHKEDEDGKEDAKMISTIINFPIEIIKLD